MERPADPLDRATDIVARIVLALGCALLLTLFYRPERPRQPAPKFTLRVDAGAATVIARTVATPAMELRR